MKALVRSKERFKKFYEENLANSLVNAVVVPVTTERKFETSSGVS